MARHLVLGNQQLLVNIDQWLQVRDIFFPHVGQYNHLMGHAHRIAVLEDNEISWVNDDAWVKKLGYLNETLVSNSSATNNRLRLSLHFNENVCCDDNVFFRKVAVKNNAGSKRKIRICFHQDFHLYGDGVGDTGLYDPERSAVIHYKKSAYFLLGILDDKHQSLLADFDINEHISPSWHCKKNPISQGEVDSMLCVDLELAPHKQSTFCFYMAAGSSFKEVHSLQDRFLTLGINVHQKNSQMCQRGWLASCTTDLSVLSKRLQELYKRSLLIIQTQTDKGGAIIAANDSDNMQFNKDTYSYMWPRDGALVAIALIRAGFADMTRPFFEFCSDVLYEKGCLLHKYNPDRTLGSSWHPWILDGKPSLPIQEDETALVLHALWTYYEHTRDKWFIKRLYPKLIKPMGEFLAGYRYKNGLPMESYDLWEERRGIFTFTTAAVIAGLSAADKLGHVFADKTFCKKCTAGHDAVREAMITYLYNNEKGYFRRSVTLDHGEPHYDEAMDSSAYALSAFDVFAADDERLVSTMQNMKEWLWVKTDVGGLARYYQDRYYRVSDDFDKVPGNPWFICTLWYAKWLIKRAERKEELKEALALIDWVADHALSTGVLAEQVHPFTGEPLSVSPLTWSHAEFVDTITDYVKKLKRLKNSRKRKVKK